MEDFLKFPDGALFYLPAIDGIQPYNTPHTPASYCITIFVRGHAGYFYSWSRRADRDEFLENSIKKWKTIKMRKSIKDLLEDVAVSIDRSLEEGNHE